MLYSKNLAVNGRSTLIWQNPVAVSKHNNYRPEMTFKFAGLKINSPNRQIKHAANYSMYTVELW